MGSEVESERFSKLSITALVLGILTYSYIYLLPQFISFMVFTLRDYIESEITIASIVGTLVFILMGLPIASIVCGSIDLKKIKAGLCSTKGKGYDISGIVLGSIFILAVLMFLLGEIIAPH